MDLSPTHPLLVFALPIPTALAIMNGAMRGLLRESEKHNQWFQAKDTEAEGVAFGRRGLSRGADFTHVL